MAPSVHQVGEGSGREVRIPLAGTALSLAVELLLVGFFVA